jgi:hypothetical protein
MTCGGAWGSLFRFAIICPEVVERPFDPFDKLRTGRLTVLPAAMSSLRSALGRELGPNGAKSKDTRFMLVLEQLHNTISPQRRAFFVPACGYCGGPVRRALSALGAVTGLGVFWV